MCLNFTKIPFFYTKSVKLMDTFKIITLKGFNANFSFEAIHYQNGRPYLFN